ncbi:MAG: alpha/beta hydrolase [Actinobacteria bacterium]|nr:alpha/beta hydrolase [Actinomycetota bacterium]
MTAADVRCDVLAAGVGPPLVLVHGGMAHCTQWVPLMARLTDHFRCYAVERPSNGASDALDHEPIVDRLAHVSRVIGDLLDGIGVTRAPIIGNSLGGLYALGFATRHPERVGHLILAGAPASHDHPVPLPVRLIAGRITGRLLKPALSRMGPKGTRRGEAQLLVANAQRLTDDYLEVGAATTRRNAEAWPSYMRWAVQGRAIHPDMPASDWAADAARLGVPLSYLWGSGDRFVPVERGRHLAHAIGADFVEIADAGHLVWLDQPDRCAEAVRAILGGSAADQEAGSDRPPPLSPA